ncbi:MAG TPA: hypothetical protein VNS34_23395 [Rhizobiaceae bacterium]|nr:hypothetical protein [Rhizobiaceae bacterium]
MSKLLVDLRDQNGDPTVVVVAHVTHLTVADSRRTTIHFTGQREIVVEGAISEIAAKLWPAY